MKTRYKIPALVRAVAVLELLSDTGEAMRLAEIAEQTEIPKSSLYRILATLQQLNCVDFNDSNKTYRLGVKVWELGSAFLNQSDLYSMAVRHMKELAEMCEESVFLGVLHEADVTYVRQMESPKSVRAVRKLGQRAPAYCTATGRAMLAFLEAEEAQQILGADLKAYSPRTTTDSTVLEQQLERIRREGVAVVDGEYNSELLCIASPIFDETNRPAASITVAMLSVQATAERVQEASEFVRQVAQGLSRDLGYLGDGKTSIKVSSDSHRANS